MVVAHLGIAVSLAGMAFESAFSEEVLVAARPGETHQVGPYAIKFDGIYPVAGPNWTAVQADLVAQRGTGEPINLAPQVRMYSSPYTETSEAAIRTDWNGQLYTVLGNGDGTGRWQLRLWWKPFVTLIWSGAILIALGGLLSLIGRVRRERRTMEREAWA